MSTDRVEIVASLIAAMQSGDIELVANTLDDSFEMAGFVSKALNKAQFLSVASALLAAMPDLSYHLADLSQTEEEPATVRATVTFTGIQSNALSLPLFGLETIPATGISVVLPQTTVAFQIQNSKVLKMSFDPITGGGFSGIVQQIGSELPLLTDQSTSSK